MNVSQQSRKEKSSRRMVRIWVDCLTWDRRWLSPNPNALAFI
jgi:hypothetical protein